MCVCVYVCMCLRSRALTESYSRAAEERDRAVAGEREASHKHEQLLQE